MRVIKRRICRDAAARIAETCYHPPSCRFCLPFFLSLSLSSRPPEFASARAHRCKWPGLSVRAPLIRLRSIRVPGKKVIIFIRTGKCLTKRVACYCSDSSRSDCCFVSLTRNVCWISESRFSDRPAALCNHKRLLMQHGNMEH